MTDGLGRNLLQLGIELVRYMLSPFLLAIALLPLSLAYEWVRNRFWPDPKDPERQAQADAWAAFKAEVEERTHEKHPRDPHVLRLPRVPAIDDAALTAPRSG